MPTVLSLMIAAGTLGTSDINSDGCVNLLDYAQLQLDWSGSDCFPIADFIEMVMIPGGGSGPDYDYEIGRFEITNAQFVRFLNDAEQDGGITLRGANLVFDLAGGVTLSDGTACFRLSHNSRLMYNQAAAVGARYRVVTGYEQHPVTGVSWLGAIKFCNWLTIVSGLGTDERCYTEGSTARKWHPSSVTDDDWEDGDLNLVERFELVMNCRGFRLPMDNVGDTLNYVGNQVNAFNEWYKAAAYDPNGPAFPRDGVDDEGIPAFYWTFGFGRDSILGTDSNYTNNGDAFDNSTTPIGFFDGVNWLRGSMGSTQPDENAFGLRDMSGNVTEWVQDQTSCRTCRATRGGSYVHSAIRTSATFREHISVTGSSNTDPYVGFRIVRVP